MVHIPRSPHRDRGIEQIRCGEPIGAFSRTRARRRCQPASDRDEDRFATLEIVQHCGDAVGPLLQGRQRARSDRIGHSRARLVEEDQSTERCHRLDPPSKGRQLRKSLAAKEPVRDKHDVAWTFTRSAIGDTQVPVQRIPRLREHCGRLSEDCAGGGGCHWSLGSGPARCRDSHLVRETLKVVVEEWACRVAYAEITDSAYLPEIYSPTDRGHRDEHAVPSLRGSPPDRHSICFSTIYQKLSRTGRYLPHRRASSGAGNMKTQ